MNHHILAMVCPGQATPLIIFDARVQDVGAERPCVALGHPQHLRPQALPAMRGPNGDVDPRVLRRRVGGTLTSAHATTVPPPPSMTHAATVRRR